MGGPGCRAQLGANHQTPCRSLSLAVLVTWTQSFQVQLRLEFRVLPMQTPPGGDISELECFESLPVSQQSSRPAAPARRPGGWRFTPDTI